MRNPALLVLLAASVLLGAAGAQPKPSRPTPTKQLVHRYEKMIAAGDLLSPQGWARAMQLYAKSKPYPANSEILLRTVGDVRTLGDTKVENGRAEVETKWTDYLGKINSELLYIPPERQVTMTSFGTTLVFTDKHQYLTAQGTLIREKEDQPEWKLEGPLEVRWSTVEHGWIT
jgi:hypothetical protein